MDTRTNFTQYSGISSHSIGARIGNLNDCFIDCGSDIDDDDFYQMTKLFDYDSNDDLDEEELVLDGTGPKRLWQEAVC
jgi:hypothetical protein